MRTVSHAMTLEPYAPVYRPPIHYPESDGKPMAETDVHRKEATAFIDALEDHFRGNSQVYVAGNNFVYYQEGNRKAVFSPDVYTVHGVEKKRRRTYKFWEEGYAPSFIMELSSRSTWKEDSRKKMQLYARLGVKEYFLYDPEADVMTPPLRAYRLDPRVAEYHRIVANADGRIISKVLGLTLWTDKNFRLHYVNTATGEELLRYGKVVALRREERRDRERAEQQRQEAERRCCEQTSRADAAERELARLRAKLGQQG